MQHVVVIQSSSNNIAGAGCSLISIRCVCAYQGWSIGRVFAGVGRMVSEQHRSVSSVVYLCGAPATQPFGQQWTVFGMQACKGVVGDGMLSDMIGQVVSGWWWWYLHQPASQAIALADVYVLMQSMRKCTAGP
jgi:hypothetical protein